MIPICNPLNRDVVLRKGVRIGEIQYADRNGAFGSSEVGEMMARLGGVQADTTEAGSANISASDTAQGLPAWLSAMYLDNQLDTSEEKAILEALLSRQVDAFKSPDQQLGRTDRVLHRIETGEARPIRVPYRRMPLHKRAAADDSDEGHVGGGSDTAKFESLV